MNQMEEGMFQFCWCRWAGYITCSIFDSQDCLRQNTQKARQHGAPQQQEQHQQHHQTATNLWSSPNQSHSIHSLCVLFLHQGLTMGNCGMCIGLGRQKEVCWLVWDDWLAWQGVFLPLLKCLILLIFGNGWLQCLWETSVACAAQASAQFVLQERKGRTKVQAKGHLPVVAKARAKRGVEAPRAKRAFEEGKRKLWPSKVEAVCNLERSSIERRSGSTSS